MSRLINLYPRAWRERYEAEFLDLIEARPPSTIERFDIVRGALDARLHPQVRRIVDEPTPAPLPDADLRIARRLGFAAVIGAVLWPAAFVVASIGPVRYDGQGAYRDGGAALPVLLLAVGLLAAGLIGHLIRLPATARLARSAAIAAIPFLLVWGMAPWLWPILLVAIGLIGVFAVAAHRSGAWPGVASLVVVAACLTVVVIGVVAANVAGGDRMAGGLFFMVGGLVLAPAWLGVSATLIRRPTASSAAAT
jgi:hypothetical protein